MLGMHQPSERPKRTPRNLKKKSPPGGMKKADSCAGMREDKPSGSDCSPAKSVPPTDNDQDFEPTAEMLVNDFDDEHTLEEEEAMESAESVTNELDDLQREGDMPLTELLARYGYNGSEQNSANAVVKTEAVSPPKGTPAASPVAKEAEPQPTKQDPSPATVVKEDSLAPPLSIKEDEEEEDDEDEQEVITVPDDPPDVPTITGPLLRSVSQVTDSSDMGTDDDYSLDDDWRKTIQVGCDFQAQIPEGLCKYDDAPAYENEDRLLWDPTKMIDEQIEEYQRQSQQPYSANTQGVHAIPVGSHIRDDEQALFLLLQCGHNMEEALRRRRMQPLQASDTMSLWSEDECRSFETGIKTYGKDFHLIQQHKVRTRSVGELVQFYYLWKKTERHDIFASKNRIEKKKYALHPGTTDYMDRFLDEQENPPIHRDRSSSPGVHSLMFGDSRKRTPASSPPATTIKNDTSLDLTPQTGNHFFLDALYSAGNEKARRSLSPVKVHSGNPVSDCSKEFLNNEDKLLSTSASRDKNNPAEPMTVAGIPTQLFSAEKNSASSPNEMIPRRPTEVRLHDTHADHARFESCREVTSIE